MNLVDVPKEEIKKYELQIKKKILKLKYFSNKVTFFLVSV